MFDINLQLFGGGGSSSGLSGKGAGGGGNEDHVYVFKLLKFNGQIHEEKFTGKTEEDARKKALKYARTERYRAVSKKPVQ